MTFKILTDSTADLDERWAQENDVELIGLTITLDDITYETVGPNRLTSDPSVGSYERRRSTDHKSGECRSI